jgi:leucyl aminopeptidase (aminopeptidase T)
MFATIERELLTHTNTSELLPALTATAIERVPGAEHSGITIGNHQQHFRTVAATSDLVKRTDEIQYRLGSGPCVDAILEDTVFNSADLTSDSRWPRFGRAAAESTGVMSMLSLRLFLEDDADIVAGMNMYATRPSAFDEVSESVALLLATHGALALSNARHREKSDNLMIALTSSRRIGVAMGIVMASNKITEDQAFDAMRIVSQHTHRKLSDLAEEVVLTGTLPAISPSTRRRSG